MRLFQHCSHVFSIGHQREQELGRGTQACLFVLSGTTCLFTPRTTFLDYYYYYCFWIMPSVVPIPMLAMLYIHERSESLTVWSAFRFFASFHGFLERCGELPTFARHNHPGTQDCSHSGHLNCSSDCLCPAHVGPSSGMLLAKRRSRYVQHRAITIPHIARARLRKKGSP
jgi:hypothetical protein